MLRSLKQLYGDRLGASDGEIGRIKDFYFDDQNWVVRYVVADTGFWLPGRLVLLSPHAFSDFHRDGAIRRVNLTRAQIEKSPAIKTHEPVSRQFEAEYYRYYEWPTYWDGGATSGLDGYPAATAPYLGPNQLADCAARPPADGDPHLRSAQALAGYKIHASDGDIGHVADFIVHEKCWEITHLVVATGHWYADKEIAIAPKHVERISYKGRTVFVGVTKKAIQGAPEYQVLPWAYEDAQDIAAGQ
jgi:hypothetical protein